jgi:phosphoserine phosphatase
MDADKINIGGVMYTHKSTKAIYIDIDNTLVFSLREYPHEVTHEVVKVGGRKFWVHAPHIEMMRDFKARGHSLIVWSAGGAEWAEAVIVALKLTDLVDVVLSKPDWYIDDKKASEFMDESKRFYKSRLIGLPAQKDEQ